jgi:hypothetical protein
MVPMRFPVLRFLLGLPRPGDTFGRPGSELGEQRRRDSLEAFHDFQAYRMGARSTAHAVRSTKAGTATLYRSWPPG